MASKKRKVDFSADAILSEISQAREFAQNVQQFRESLSLVKIKEMLGTVQTVNFDVAGLLALLLGFDVVMWSMLAINHVPKAFDHYKKSRGGIIHKIVDFFEVSKTKLRCIVLNKWEDKNETFNFQDRTVYLHF